MLIKLPFLLPGSIFRSPMPFSQFDRSSVWTKFQEEKIDLVVILVEQQEYLVFAGKDLPALYRSQGLDVQHIAVPDFGIPEDLESWKNGLETAAMAAGDGKNVVVHCLAGIGRTGIFLACLAKQVLNMEGEEAINWVRKSVPGAMENSRQEDFVIHFQPDNQGKLNN
jgi:protein-tyrosine phosphatase